MDNKGYGSISGTLFDCCITFLARDSLVRYFPKFIELLIGGLCSPRPDLSPGPVAGNQPAAELKRLLQMAPGGQVVLGRLGDTMARMVVAVHPKAANSASLRQGDRQKTSLHRKR